jgi:uncharacterized protein (TIGR02246 family)
MFKLTNSLVTIAVQTLLVLTLLLAAGLLACAKKGEVGMSTGPMSPALSSEDETRVHAVVAGFANTWNRHDMKSMHELDTDDVEWINVVGNHWRGKDAVYKGHDAIHRTIVAKTNMSVEDTVIRAIAPGVAVAVATMKFGPTITPSGQGLREAKTRGSFILVKSDGGWKIAHFQNTVVDPDAEKNDPVTWDSTGFLPGQTKQ